MKHALGTTLFLVLALPLVAQEAARERPPIIDIHLHAYPGNWSEANAPVNPVTGKPSAARTGDQLMSKTLEALRRYNIVKAVTSGPLDVVERWRAAAPERIIPALTFAHPDEINLDSLRELVTRGDVAVLGEVWTQFAGLSPSDPALEPILALAEELDLPVAIHMGMAMPGTAYYFASPDYRARLTNPLLLEEALLKHPKQPAMSPFLALVKPHLSIQICRRKLKEKKK